MANAARSPLGPRRVIAAAAALTGVVLAGCGGGSHPTARAPGTSIDTTSTSTTAPAGTSTTSSGGGTTPSTAVPTTAAGAGVCSTAQLSLALSGANSGAGSTFVVLSLLNTSTTSSCTMNGYPGVSYVTGANGTQVGPAATRDPSTPEVAVVLAPGHAATAKLRLVNPYNFDQAACGLTPTLGLRVYPPGQTVAGFVSDPGMACAGQSLPQPALFVTPVQAGPTAGGIG